MQISTVSLNWFFSSVAESHHGEKWFTEVMNIWSKVDDQMINATDNPSSSSASWLFVGFFIRATEIDSTRCFFELSSTVSWCNHTWPWIYVKMWNLYNARCLRYKTMPIQWHAHSNWMSLSAEEHTFATQHITFALHFGCCFSVFPSIAVCPTWLCRCKAPCYNRIKLYSCLLLSMLMRRLMKASLLPISTMNFEGVRCRARFHAKALIELYISMKVERWKMCTAFRKQHGVCALEIGCSLYVHITVWIA